MGRKIVVQIQRNKVNDFLDQAAFEQIGKLGDVIWNPLDRAWTTEELKKQLGEAEAVVTSWGSTPISEEVLDAAPKLRLIAHMAGTVKPVVTTLKAYDRGVTVLTSNYAIAVSVSEAVVAFILALGHKMVAIDQAMKNGLKWNSPELDLEAFELRGRTVGLVGLGLVAHEVIKLLKPFDVEVLACDPFLSEEKGRQMCVELVGLQVLMRRSDIVSLHAPEVPETRHMIGGEELALLKDGALLINTARGSLIDEPAMIRELRKKRIYAGLDVFEQEPLPVESELRKMDNVIILPHLAGVNPSSKRRIGKYMVDEMHRFFNEEPLSFQVKKEHLANMT
jgi:phosphoglycerate dehydrogenase-like enzyme